MKKSIIILILMLFVHIAVTTVDASSEPDIKLPKNSVTMNAEYHNHSWFIMTITEVPEGYDIVDGKYWGWCAQVDVLMSRGVNHGVNLFSSYDPDMPQNFKSDNWDKINYIINHDDSYSKESIQNAIWYYIDGLAYPSDPDAKALINDTDENGEGFIPQPGDTIAILIEGVESIQRSFLELTVPEVSSPTPEEEKPKNHPPTADASAGQPYIGLVGQEIIFNSSRSYDRDGRIISYYWDFGDGNNSSEKITSHIYYQAGRYTVKLTVTDDDFAKDTHEVTAIISLENKPPEPPILTGPKTGNKNILYNFTVNSSDPENDELQYIINWGDGEKTITEFLSYVAKITHSWTEAGSYIITITASDNITESETTTYIMMIDAIYVGNLGYLIDADNDGIYDSFYSNSTETKITVGTSNQNYLIDTDGDGNWDYEYNPLTDKTETLKSESSSEGLLSRNTLIIIVILVIVIILIIIFALFTRRKNK